MSNAEQPPKDFSPTWKFIMVPNSEAIGCVVSGKFLQAGNDPKYTPITEPPEVA